MSLLLQASNYSEYINQTYLPFVTSRSSGGMERAAKLGGIISFRSFDLHVKVGDDDKPQIKFAPSIPKPC